MPTYQYVCKACGEGLEAVQSFHDAPLTECPACGGALRKVFSSVGVVFKGSGFYRTDSRKAESSGSSGSGSSDAKPAAGATSGAASSAAPSSSASPKAAPVKAPSGSSAA